MDDGPWIVIPRWDDFQHRDSARSQIPPWIKDHTEQLAKDDYRDLSFAQRGLLQDIRKEFARSRRELRGNTAGLSQRLGKKVTKKMLQPLIDAGFIQLSASRPARNPAGVPAGVEKEKEKETPKPPSALTAKREKPYTPRENVVPKDPVVAIETMIRNGVIQDPVDLEAELRGAAVNSETAERLKGML